uniref:Translational initiation factor 1 n=1 Tax=Plukenetia volubilis TaxID=316893 RepID=A0A291LRR2_9ROSI|nr:translational initiation factor 1 [Plukenetia volubilis]
MFQVPLDNKDLVLGYLSGKTQRTLFYTYTVRK